MRDAGFVFAAYGAILGGIGLYAALLVRRLRAAGGVAQPTRGETDAPPTTPDAPR
jgi:hypothetical protein